MHYCSILPLLPLLPLLLFSLFSLYTHSTIDTLGLESVHTGMSSAALEKLWSLAPKLARGPIPPIWLPHTPHSQFPLFVMQGEIHQHLFPIDYTFFNFTVTDTVTFDPDLSETVSIAAFPGFGVDLPSDAPVILINPGLRCNSGDIPGSSVVRRAYMKGYRSVVFNRRGHGGGGGGGSDGELESARFNVRKRATRATRARTEGKPTERIYSHERSQLWGDTGDLEMAYWEVRKRVGDSTDLFLYGVSSGTAVTVTAMGVWGEKRRKIREGGENRSGELGG